MLVIARDSGQNRENSESMKQSHFPRHYLR
jgi:hypothetical protein